MVQSSNEFLQGLHIDRLQRQVGDISFDAEQARNNANIAENRADRAEDRTLKAIEGLVNLRQNYDRLLKDAKEKDHTIDLWVEHDKKQKAEIARLKDELAMASAGRDGLRAQGLAFKAELPTDADILSDSGERFEDGSIKNKSRILFEKAFDATARKFGITNPSSRRTN